MRNNHVRKQIEYPWQGDAKNNPIYAENFHGSLRGDLPNGQLNHLVTLDEPDGDDDDDEDDVFYQIAVNNSLSDYGITEFINLDDYYWEGKKSFQAIPSYVNVGESSSSSRKIPTVDCGICFEEVLEPEMFDIIGCSHRYCANCVRKHITAKLSEGVLNIMCLECKDGFLLPHACRMILPKEVYSNWGDKLCEEMLPEKTKMYCPFKDCSALLINDGEGIRQSRCPHCNRMFCARCKVPWHINFRCEDYQKLSENERQTEDLLLMKVAKDNKWARCSKCQFFVERSHGCMYMLCRCGNAFCYGCGTEMSGTSHFCTECNR